MKLLTLEDFAGCLNSTFTASINEGNVDFFLVEARPLPPPKHDAMRAPFSLLFRNTAALLFPQQTYTMHHPRIGDFAIFMVPIAREQAGFLYQAVFN